MLHFDPYPFYVACIKDWGTKHSCMSAVHKLLILQFAKHFVDGLLPSSLPIPYSNAEHPLLKNLIINSLVIVDKSF